MSERPLPRRSGERILAWALAGHIVHADDWWPGPGPDGGPGVRAVRSRISDLERDEGYGFHHTRRPDGTVEYRLAHVPGRPASVKGVKGAARPPQPELGADVDQLALEIPPAPLNAALHDWDNAA